MPKTLSIRFSTGSWRTQWLSMHTENYGVIVKYVAIIRVNVRLLDRAERLAPVLVRLRVAHPNKGTACAYTKTIKE